ncbi:MAG: hypothetical protein U0W24_07145 [Bacteroidales bacterium]
MGTGARVIEVSGITINGYFEKEVIELNGLTPVNTFYKYNWLKMKVKQAGILGKNAGIITATAATDSTITCSIQADRNKSEQAIIMMPRSLEGLIKYFYVSAKNETLGAITYVTILTKEEGRVWKPEFEIDLTSNNPVFEDKNTGILPKINPLSLMKVSAISSDGSSEVYVNFRVKYI